MRGIEQILDTRRKENRRARTYRKSTPSIKGEKRKRKDGKLEGEGTGRVEERESRERQEAGGFGYPSLGER